MSDLDNRNMYVSFIGVVEDRQDPMKQNRVRVRCFHFHPESKSLVPTNHLPWARVPIATSHRIKEGDHVRGYFEDGFDAQIPVVTEIIHGIPETAPDPNTGFNDPRTAEQRSNAPRAPKEIKNPGNGTGVQLIEQNEGPLYPARLNEPILNRLARNENLDDYNSYRNSQRLLGYDLGIQDVVLGVTNSFLLQAQTYIIGKLATVFGSIPGLSQLTSTLFSLFWASSGYKKFTLPTTYNQPSNPYNAQYPYNNAKVSESGHIHEVDDTPGSERIHVRHRSGTSYEMYPDGNRVDYTANDHHHIIEGSSYNIVKGGKQVITEGSRQVIVRGADYVQIEGVSKVVIIGDAEVSVQGNKIERIQGNYTLEVGGDITVGAAGGASYKSGSSVTVASNQDVYIGADSNVKLKASDKLYFDIGKRWDVLFDEIDPITRLNIRFDMKAAGVLTRPINLGPLTLQPYDIDTTLAIDFTGAEFAYTPKVGDDTVSEIQRQVDGGTLVIDIHPNNKVIPSSNTSSNGISVAG
jgi:hypothetical protein